MSLSNPRLSDAIGVVGIVLLMVALSVRSYHMPSRGHSALTQQEFLRFDLVPTVLAALFFVWALATPCLHNAMADNVIRFFAWSPHALLWYGLVGGMAIYLVSWFAGKAKYEGFSDFRRSLIGWIAAGAVFGILMAVGVMFAHHCSPPGREVGNRRARAVHLRRAVGDDEPAGRGDRPRRAHQRAGRRRQRPRMARPRRRLDAGRRRRMAWADGARVPRLRLGRGAVSTAAVLAGADQRRLRSGDRTAREVQPDPHHRRQEQAADRLPDQHGLCADHFGGHFRHRRW